ncbi:MAG TPA: hypothetical protein DCZ87_04655 [Chitinophagaceae bacterium]|nr:hypothetical protein [Chitinophagaceae bacterium]
MGTGFVVALVGLIFLLSGRVVLATGIAAALLLSSASAEAAGSGVPGAIGASLVVPAVSLARVGCPPPPPPSSAAGGSGGQLTSTSTLLASEVCSKTGIFHLSKKRSRPIARAVAAVIA